MKVYCHRAGNNLSLIHPLKAAGFRTVEGDVMFAREASIMVHPAGLPKRLPDGNLDYTSGEVVQQLADQGIAVPTLAGMLELIQEEEMRLLLEIKIPGTFRRIVPQLIGRKGVTIISFMGDELVQAAGYHSTDPRNFGPPGVLMAHAPSADVAAAMLVGYAARMVLLDQWYLDVNTAGYFRLRGYTHAEVVAYTVNDLERARVLARMGVDAILSDKPRELVDAAQGGWLEPG